MLITSATLPSCVDRLKAGVLQWLYGKKCQFPLCCAQSLLGPDLVRQTTEQVKRIKERILTAQSRQKSYADKRRKVLEFQEREHIFLKITPTTGIVRAMRVKKLSPYFLGPFQILKRIGSGAYRMALPLVKSPQWLSCIPIEKIQFRS